MLSRIERPDRDVTGRTIETPFTEAQGARGEPLDAAGLVPAHLLDGGEIIILAIKPSLWFVVFASAKWVLGMAAVIALIGWLGHRVPQVSAGLIVQAAAVLAVARVGLAFLQWISRLYVLTNRRIMRLTGIFNIDLFECSLTKIQQTYLSLSWYERLAGVGTIAFATSGTGGVEASWHHVPNPLELHERIRSAIHRAQGPPDAF